jgi:hypothetical protein
MTLTEGVDFGRFRLDRNCVHMGEKNID